MTETEGVEIPESALQKESRVEEKVTWPEMYALIQPGPEGEQVIKNPWLRNFVSLLCRSPLSRLTLERLNRWLDQGDDRYVDGKLPEDEWAIVAGVIYTKIEELERRKTEEEPEIVRLERPKSLEEAVGVFLREIFDLHERGLREDKQWEAKGEFYSEYTALKRWVDDLPEEVQRESRKHEELSRYLRREYPHGVYLKERLELLLEAMKRLHNRQIEVIRAEGGLEDLGVGKTGEAAAPILKVPFTNIRPVDWYVLTHIDELFPESNSPESKIKLEAAWSLWQKIGRNPYGFFEYAFDEKTNKAVWVLRKDISDEEAKKLNGKWDLLRWDLDRLEPIKVLEAKNPEKVPEKGFTLQDLYTSERVMALVRDKIARNVGEGLAGIWAESLAHSILTVSLTFDVWDRERWKQKGKQEARDLMWFDLKRTDRFLQLRPCGPANTVGCYWADEGLFEKAPKDLNELLKNKRINPLEKERKLDYLTRNITDALFHVRRSTPSEGTIIGDFFSSTFYTERDEEEKKKYRLSDRSLKEIPWLEPGMFEEETYEGYFTYSMMMAARIENYINRLEWKPEELKNRDFWVRLGDVTLRLAHFCPWLTGEETDHVILKFRRILARGIFWTGSYLAQSHPERPFASGTFSKDDVYGESFLGIQTAPGILDAIEASGYLDEENLKKLRQEIWDFNFHMKGRK